MPRGGENFEGFGDSDSHDDRKKLNSPDQHERQTERLVRCRPVAAPRWYRALLLFSAQTIRIRLVRVGGILSEVRTIDQKKFIGLRVPARYRSRSGWE